MPNNLLKHFFLAGFLLATLAACSNQDIKPSGDESAESAEPGAGSAQEMPTREEIEAQAQEIPERPMDAETMALLLEAELALFRGELELALDIYEQLTSSTEDVGIAQRSAEIAMATGDPFRFLDAALYYLELAPESDIYAFELAVRALARSAEIEGAWALLSEYPERTYQLRLATSEAVRLAGQMQDNYQIEWLLGKILEAYGEDTENTEVQLSLGIIYEALKNHEMARVYAERASVAEPDSMLAFRLRLNALIGIGDNNEAVKVITAWIEEHRDDAETRISLAKMLVSIDQQAALPVLEELAEDYPWSGELLLITAQIHLASDTPETAIPYYQKLAQLGEFRAIAFFNIARIYERQEELELAAQNYAQVTTANISEEDMDMLFEAQLRLGRLRYLIGEDGHSVFEEMRVAYTDQAVSLFHEEASILMDLGSYPDAITLLTQGIADQPDAESLYYSRSVAYERNNQVDLALADLRTMLAKDENNSMALNALGYMLTTNDGDLQEANNLIDRALELDPDDPAIIDSKGWVLFKMGEFEEALTYLQRAHDSLVDEEVISHLAEVLLNLGREEEARQVLQDGAENLPYSELIPETRTRLGLDD